MPATTPMPPEPDEADPADDRAGWDMLARLHDELGTRGIPVIVVSTEQGILDEVLARPGAYGLPATLMLPMDVPTILTQVRRMIPAEA